MVQTLEAIKGGGGSVKVGTVGTISSLITRELEPTGSTSHIPSSFRSNPPIVGSSTSCNAASFKLRTSLDLASKGGTSSNIEHSSPENIQRTRERTQHRIPVHSPTTPRRQKQKTLPNEGSSRSRKSISWRSPDLLKTRSYERAHRIPMLGSKNIVLDKTPKKEKLTKKGSSIVDIVDIHCGSPSLANRLKKLGFSKLSQSFI